MQIIFMQGISKQWPCLAQAPGGKNIFHAMIISCTTINNYNKFWKQNICKPMLTPSRVLMWIYKLNKVNILQEVEIEFAEKWFLLYGMPKQRVY